MAIRVLLADDSMVMRHMVKNILDKEPDIEVVDTAKNGKEAFLKTQELNPDVVLMDMIMGNYDGIYGVENIMKYCPTPVVLLSAIGNTNLKPILRALDLGAFDYVNKPQENNTKVSQVGGIILEKVRAAAQTDIKKLPLTEIKKNHHPHTFGEKLPYEVIIIGASTGGPTAVQKVISKLPSNLKLPVVIVQHMPQNFIKTFVQRLGELCPLPVIEAENEMVLAPGFVHIAPGKQNTKLVERNGKVYFSKDKKNYAAYNNPSVNAMMVSAATIFDEKVIGILLTGMGKDGAEGMKKIKEKGGLTLVQNKESSVVFGMPKEAIALGIVDAVMDVKDISGYVISSLA